MPFDFGGSAERTRGDSESQSFVWPEQARFLQRLYGQAEQLFQQQQGDIGAAARMYSQQALQPVQTGLQTLGNVASGMTPGMQFMADRFSQANPFLEQSIADYGQDIARNMAENILPEIRSGGVATGQLGGSRDYIAQGMAAQEAQRTFARGAQSMRMNDLGARTAAAQQFTGSQLAATAGMFQGAPMVSNLGMMPYNAAWMPALQLSNVYGRPTVLSRSESDQETDAGSFEFGF